MTHRPERMCIGCRGRGGKSELLRLVARAAQVVVDVSQSEPGRGAYLHRDPGCLELAVRRRAIGRALRTALPDGGQLVRAVEPHVSSGQFTAEGRSGGTA